MTNQAANDDAGDVDGTDDATKTDKTTGFRLLPIHEGNANQFDVENKEGTWIFWVRRVAGVLTLQSTSVPLTEDERQNYASVVARMTGEMVAS